MPTIKKGTQTGRDEHLPEFNVKKVIPFGINEAGNAESIEVREGATSVHSVGEIDTGNSTTTVLDPGGVNVFTGDSMDIIDESMIVISLKASHASATDGLSVQQSTDGTNWDHTDEFTIPADTGKTFSFQPAAKFLRVVYTNGGTLQTFFRLQTVLKSTYVKPSSHRIQDSIINDDDAELVKAVLTAKANGGGFVNITATESDNLRVTDAESGLAIAKGDVVNTTFVHKFGNAPDFDTGDGVVDIWDGANDGGIDAMVYTYSTTADIDSIVSSDAGDTQDMEIQGLDTYYNLVTQTKTLTGQTRVALDTDLIRVFRMKNVGATNLAGNVSCYVDSTITAGVVDDKTKVRAIILDGNNQTLMALYTVPAGKTAYARDWYASTSGGSRNSNYVMDLYARPFGQVFQLKHKSAISDTGTSYIQHKYIEPEVLPEKTDMTMRVSITEAAITGGSVSAGFDIVLIDN